MLTAKERWGRGYVPNAPNQARKALRKLSNLGSETPGKDSYINILLFLF